jgi:pimeloyl-ACP methyl ester carboxylesterase
VRNTHQVANVHTCEVGTFEPTLLFVHGFACAMDDYAAQLSGLSDNFRCIAMDLPGHGESAMPNSPTISALAAAVNGVKQRSGAQRTVLVGHSMGSKVAREAYRQSPDGVAGLVFLDSSIYVGEPEALTARLRNQIDSAGFPTFVKRLFNGMFFDGSDPELCERMVARALQSDPAFAESLLMDAIRWELGVGNAAMQHINVPTLVLQSTYFNSDFQRVPLQPGITTPFMHAVQQAVPRTVVRTLTGVGHLPMIEAPRAVNQHIRAFASQLS